MHKATVTAARSGGREVMQVSRGRTPSSCRRRSRTCRAAAQNVRRTCRAKWRSLEISNQPERKLRHRQRVRCAADGTPSAQAAAGRHERRGIVQFITKPTAPSLAPLNRTTVPSGTGIVDRAASGAARGSGTRLLPGDAVKQAHTAPNTSFREPTSAFDRLTAPHFTLEITHAGSLCVIDNSGDARRTRRRKPPNSASQKARAVWNQQADRQLNGATRSTSPQTRQQKQQSSYDSSVVHGVKATKVGTSASRPRRTAGPRGGNRLACALVENSRSTGHRPCDCDEDIRAATDPTIGQSCSRQAVRSTC